MFVTQRDCTEPDQIEEFLDLSIQGRCRLVRAGGSLLVLLPWCSAILCQSWGSLSDDWQRKIAAFDLFTSLNCDVPFLFSLQLSRSLSLIRIEAGD